MVPRLYSADTTNYGAKAGIGSLVDAISCTVTESRNSSYELELEYPITGAHYADITRSRIIFAKANAIDSYPQLFRIYDISKPIAGIVTVHASHVAYDLEGIPVKPFTATTAAEALTALKSGSLVANNFTFRTDVTTSNSYKLEAPKNAWEVLADIVSYYGGDLHFNGWNVELLKSRGSDKHAVLSYGKNLTDLTQDESIADTYTGCIAYWISSDKSTSVYSDVQYAADHASFAAEKIYMLDCSSDFTAAPTASELNAKAASYVTDNGLGVPKTTITVSYVDLAKATEYDTADGDAIGMCDTITVSYATLGVSTKPKVLQTKWDVLMDRYSAIQLGNTDSAIKKDLADVIADTAKTATEAKAEAISTVPSGSSGGNSGTVTKTAPDWFASNGYGCNMAIDVTALNHPTTASGIQYHRIRHIMYRSIYVRIYRGNTSGSSCNQTFSAYRLPAEYFMVDTCLLKNTDSDAMPADDVAQIIPSLEYDSKTNLYNVNIRLDLKKEASKDYTYKVIYRMSWLDDKDMNYNNNILM